MIGRGRKAFSLLVLSAAVLAGCGRAAQPLMNAATALNASALERDDGDLSEEKPSSSKFIIHVPSHPLRPAPEVTHGNQAELSVGPAETFPAVSSFIKGAQHTLWIEMFEFGGTYAQKLVPLLVERAKLGVQVKLLMDQAGSQVSPKGIRPYLKQLREAGIDVQFYPMRLRRDGVHWRFNITHRKLMLADATVAMEGGTNFGTGFESLTRDLMVRWQGPVVRELYEEFATQWRMVTGLPVSVPPAPAVAGDIDAQVAVTSVPEGRFEIRNAVFKAIDNAKSEIRLEHQYLWEDDLEAHLHAALKRGVKVRCIVPGGTKEKEILSTLNNEALRRLTEDGAEARVYVNADTPESHLHVKHYSVDDNWVAVGSCNGDARSLLDHQELDVLSTSPAWVSQVRQRLFERDWAESTKPWVYKPCSWVNRPFRSILELVDYLF